MRSLSRLLRLSLLLLIPPMSNTLIAFADEPKAPSVVIGAILPLSGSAAAFGVSSSRGITLALEGLSAVDRERVKVIIEDDGLNNSRSITAAQKLITVDKVDALLTWSSGTALAVKSLSESRRIPHMAVASDPAVARESNYSFTYWPIPESETRTLYDYLKSRNKRRIAMITQINSFPLAMRDAFVANVARDKVMEIVADEEVSPDTTDARSTLLRIKSKGAIDTLIVASFPGQLELIVKQAREVGITAPLFGYETFEDKTSFAAAGGLFTGVIYSTGADAREDFRARFAFQYPGESDYTASHSYDIIRLFVDATRKQKDGDSIAHFLRTLKDYPTASGTISSTGDNRFTLPITLKTLDSKGIPHPVE